MADWTPDAAFTFTTRDGETVGPIREDAAHVHYAAREAARLAGGAAAVWVRRGGQLEQVAEYR